MSTQQPTHDAGSHTRENISESESARTHVSRRGVLAIGGVIGAAGLVAACGGGGSGADATSTGAAPTVPPDPSPTSGGGTSGDGLTPVSDIPVGGGRVFNADKVVVTQPSEGTIRGFTAVCPHQGCLVSSVQDNEILCPCHGSYFDADTGEVLRGPATRGLAQANVGVEDGFIVLP
jgi:nitrite reductase/ring-hydroxylating ferredoxin subunit